MIDYATILESHLIAEEGFIGYTINNHMNKKDMRSDRIDFTPAEIDKLLGDIHKKHMAGNAKFLTKPGVNDEIKKNMEMLNKPFFDGNCHELATIIIRNKVVTIYDEILPHEGYAMMGGDRKLMIALGSRWFSLSKPTQRFILMHEIGHIALGHINALHQLPRLVQLIFNPRIMAAKKGRVLIQEQLADAYAIKHGCDVQGLVGMLIGSIKEDSEINRIFGRTQADTDMGNREIKVRVELAQKRNLL